MRHSRGSRSRPTSCNMPSRAGREALHTPARSTSSSSRLRWWDTRQRRHATPVTALGQRLQPFDANQLPETTRRKPRTGPHPPLRRSSAIIKSNPQPESSRASRSLLWVRKRRRHAIGEKSLFDTLVYQVAPQPRAGMKTESLRGQA